jgi:hypothetical protein
MSTEMESKYFITSNLALCGYLEVVGKLRYVKAEIRKNNKGKYNVDFYSPKYNLVIEYDEPYHKYRKKEDRKRQSRIHVYEGRHSTRSPRR